MLIRKAVLHGTTKYINLPKIWLQGNGFIDKTDFEIIIDDKKLIIKPVDDENKTH